jgi:hypothetical protein
MNRNKFMIPMVLLLIMSVFIMFILALDHRNKFIQIRSDVWVKTGYDISYPEKWKGICK